MTRDLNRSAVTAMAAAAIFAAASAAQASYALPADLDLAQAELQADRNNDGMISAAERRAFQRIVDLSAPAWERPTGR